MAKKARKPTVKAATARKAAAQAVKAAIKSLPQKRHGGPPAARQVSQALKRVVDRHHVLDLKIKGLSWRQIGERLGISHVHAMTLGYEAAGELVVEDAAKAPVLRAIENERLDEAHRALVPLQHGQIPTKTTVTRTKKGVVSVPVPNDPVDVARVQLGAVGRIVQISERRSTLNGLNAPLKIAPTRPDGSALDGLSMSDDELSRDVTALEARAASLGLPAIDVTPGKNGHGSNGNGQP